MEFISLKLKNKTSEEVLKILKNSGIEYEEITPLELFFNAEVEYRVLYIASEKTKKLFNSLNEKDKEQFMQSVAYEFTNSDYSLDFDYLDDTISKRICEFIDKKENV